MAHLSVSKLFLWLAGTGGFISISQDTKKVLRRRRHFATIEGMTVRSVAEVEQIRVLLETRPQALGRSVPAFVDSAATTLRNR